MVSFVAPSGTGKTTLLTSVIALLSGRGHRVGAVKHDAHRIELDTEGKDSWRLREAGAAGTLLMGRDQLAFFGAGAEVPDLHTVVPLLFGQADLVLVEGFRSAGLPTVVVARSGIDDRSWEPPDPGLVVMTARPDEGMRVADLLEARYLGHANQPLK
ncbi:MAG: molybdopterin-guanine dinucleotide biosynthesis protein B [Actinomycetota bacterium]